MRRPSNLFTGILIDPDQVARKITYARGRHARFTLAWCAPGLIVYLAFALAFRGRMEVTIQDALVSALVIPLAMEFSMSVLTDDLFSFLAAGAMFLALGAAALLFPEGNFFSGVLAGVMFGSAACMVTAFGPFDVFPLRGGRSRIPPRRLVPYYLLTAAATIALIAASGTIVGGLDARYPTAASLLVMGASWAVFSVNGSRAVPSQTVVKVFLVVSALPVAWLIVALPGSVVFAADHNTQLSFSAAWVVACIFSFPINMHARKNFGKSSVPDDRKNISLQAMDMARYYMFIWFGTLILALVAADFFLADLGEPLLYLAASLVLAPAGINAIFDPY